MRDAGTPLPPLQKLYGTISGGDGPPSPSRPRGSAPGSKQLFHQGDRGILPLFQPLPFFPPVQRRLRTVSQRSSARRSGRNDAAHAPADPPVFPLLRSILESFHA